MHKIYPGLLPNSWTQAQTQIGRYSSTQESRFIGSYRNVFLAPLVKLNNEHGQVYLTWPAKPLSSTQAKALELKEWKSFEKRFKSAEGMAIQDWCHRWTYLQANDIYKPGSEFAGAPFKALRVSVLVTRLCLALRPYRLQPVPLSMEFPRQEYWSG